MLLDREYDVIVAGAGPGGSAVAKRCAELGLEVAMLEKRAEIGAPKRCAEGLSSRAIQELGQKIPSYCIMQTIDGAFVNAPNGKRVVIDYGEVRGFVLERKQYDKWLAEEAARAGAKVQSKTEVVGLVRKGEKICGVEAEFGSEKFTINSKVVVAADGVESKVARLAEINTVNKPINIDSGVQFEMVDIKMEDPHKLDIYLGNKIAPRGYIWIFPKGEDKANVGIGVGGYGHEKTAFHYLMEFVKSKPELRKGSITEVNAGGIPVGGFLENMVGNGILVVGDAAHQVNPIHGGGMYEAAVAGKMAGDVIFECVQKEDVSQPALAKYNKIWWEQRGESLKKVEKLREVMEKLSDEDYNMLAETLTGDDIVDFTHGNSLHKLGKILMRNPGLLALARHLM